jgi:DNA/RNA endonuclease G (NUC1)
MVIIQQDITATLVDSHSHFLNMLPKALENDWIDMKENMTSGLSNELVFTFRPTAYVILLQSSSKDPAWSTSHLQKRTATNIDSTANRLSDAWKIHVDKTLPRILKIQIKDWKSRGIDRSHHWSK